MEKKIYFSPSDQRHNPYAYGGLVEATVCREIARQAVAAARRCGFDARTNTTDNGDDAMDKRIRESNDWGADIHLPIHTNACNGKVMGTRLMYGCEAGRRLCRAIMDTLAPITPGVSDGISEGRWAEIVRTNATACYIEVGFHDAPIEAEWLALHTGEIAEEIVRGCCNYFGVRYIAPDGSTAPEPPAEPDKPKGYYRVRRTWADASGQLGAYLVLEGAKRACPMGYTVFAPEGKPVYHVVAEKETLWGLAAQLLGSGSRYMEIVKASGLTKASIFPGTVLLFPE